MFRRDLAGALRDAGAERVPGEAALGALVAALFGTLQPPYFGPREFEALHRALSELDAARGPGAAALCGALVREPEAEPEAEPGVGLEPGAEGGEVPGGEAGDGTGAASGEGEAEAEEAPEARRGGGGDGEEGGDPGEALAAPAPPPCLRAADVRALLEEALQADGGGGNTASVAGPAELRAALEGILANLGASPDDPDAEIAADALADALTAVELPTAPGAPRDRALHGKWWDWQEGKVSW